MRLINANPTGSLRSRLLRICGMLFLTAVSIATADAQVTATPPYTVSVFATSVPHVYY
jgi:hypothetical protein